MIVSNNQDLTCLEACAMKRIPANASVYVHSQSESSSEESFSKDSRTKPLFAISRNSKPRPKPSTAKVSTKLRQKPRAGKKRVTGVLREVKLPQAGFLCKICGVPFERQTSLGGHMSKMHPGNSKAYLKKMETFNKNSFDREMRKQAQRLLGDVLPPKLLRPKVTQLKKWLMQKDKTSS